MPQPTPAQVQIANEVLAGTREIMSSNAVTVEEPTSPAPEPTASAPTMSNEVLPPAGLSEEAQRQALDVGSALSTQIQAADTTGSTTLSADPALAVKQWQFERSEVAQDIQKVNDIKTPGE